MSGNSEKEAPAKILVDTNMWLDYYLTRSDEHGTVTEFLARAQAGDFAVYATSLSLKDVAYLVECDMKAQVRAAGQAVTLTIAAAAQEVAWGCVRNMLELALVVPIGQTEAMQAFTYKSVHPDFEEDLIIAAAWRAGADWILTRDKKLAQHSPIPCLSAEGALKLPRRTA